MGELIEFMAGRGYLARPSRPSTKGVLVLQEWWGLVPHIQDVADRIAAEGYLALAPDFWDGQVAKTADEASQMMMKLSLEKATAQLAGACDAIGAAGAEGKLGVVGFCMGGALALHAGCGLPEQIGACVDFYGVHPHIQPDFGALRAPVLAFFGEDDSWLTPEVVRGLDKRVKDAGGRIETHIYPHAGHAFFNDSRPEAYKAQPAKDAWIRMLRFFEANL